jgi:hypothetical protein
VSGRDEQLGQALRGLDVPDHGPDFYPRLLARLEEESARHPGSARRPRPRPRWTNPYLLTAAAAAVVVIVLATSTVFTGDGTRPPTGPVLITASEVRARVAGALASLETLQGVITAECEGPAPACQSNDTEGRTTRQWSFVTTADGDERVTGIGTTNDLAFSSATRTYRQITTLGGRSQASESVNVPAGAPDFGSRSILRRELGSVVRAFISDTSEVPVTDTVEQDRPAWRLVVPVTVNKLGGPGASGDQLEVLVDRESGFPLRITETLKGAFLQEIRLSNLVADEPVDPATFVLEFPADVDVFHQDRGFHRVTLDEAAAVVGYRPMLPTDLPAGFELAVVTAAAAGGGTGMEGMNPAAGGVVSVAYRRGFDEIVVSTRKTGGVSSCASLAPPITTDCWSDPVASGEGDIDVPQPFVVEGGALMGANAAVVVSPRGTPHVWSIDDRLVVTVAGDASGDELRRMAESFAPA